MTPENRKLDAKSFALFEASLKQDKAIRRDWIIAQAGADTALRDKTLKLLASDENQANVLLTGGAISESYIDETPPERIGVYKISDLIGQGGMGAVYKAVRDVGDFDHAVAIKLIKPGIISDSLKQRFAHEQQVLAGFSHPNIARLYDGGTTDEGRPYIIMELIDGVPITNWVDQNNMDTEDCLALFKTACQAVAYAHQNLIIHRDLTPSNVLVGTDGIVKLIDFGIAKPYDEDAATQDMSGSPNPSLANLTFTPGFAAPERSKGAVANTLSDIYSLGKLLSAILPGNINDPDLDAIITKATALTPDGRYASVGALIDDLENFNTGYPVAARNGGTSYKIKKFIGRNKLATGLASLATTGLIGGLILTTTLYRQAETARKEADARFEQVRELANFMLFDLYDELQIVPGNTKSLSAIADKSKSYLDALSDTKRVSLDLRIETAIGYKRLSDVMGNPITTNLGRRKQSAQLLDTAYGKLEKLRTDNPGNIDIKRALAEAIFSRAVFAFIAEDNTADTLKYSKQAESLYMEIIDSGKATVKDHVGRLRASLQAARTYSWDGRGAQGIVILKQLAKQSAAYADKNRTDIASNLVNAAIHSETALTISSHYSIAGGDANEALPYINEAIAIYKQMVQAYPENLKPQRNLVSTYYKRAIIGSGLEKYDDMLKDLVEADRIAGQFLARDPDDRGMLRIALAVRQLKSKTLARLQQYKEAIELSTEILDSIKKAYEKEPDSPGRAREYANALANHASILALNKQTPEACQYYGSALDIWNIIEARWGITDFDKKNAVMGAEQFIAKCP